MITQSTAVKIALSRRKPPTTAEAWRTEFFDVTQGVIDANKIVLAAAPIANTEMLKLNGLEMVNHPDWDYTITGNEVIFGADILLTVGDTIRARYKA